MTMHIVSSFSSFTYLILDAYPLARVEDAFSSEVFDKNVREKGKK